MKLRERIENNLVVWLLSTLLTGFLAGIGTYRSIIEMAQLKTVSASEYEKLTAASYSEQSDPPVSLYLAAGSAVNYPDWGFAIELAGYRPNFYSKTQSMDFLIFYLKSKNQRISKVNETSPEIPRDHFVFRADLPQRLAIGQNVFEILLQNPQVSNNPNAVDGVQMILTKK